MTTTVTKREGVEPARDVEACHRTGDLLAPWDEEVLAGSGTFVSPEDLLLWEGSPQAGVLKDSRGPVNTETCVHHWIIDQASGPTGRGVCKHCGAEKTFQNYWEDDPLRDYTKGTRDSSGWDPVYERDGELVRGLRQSGGHVL